MKHNKRADGLRGLASLSVVIAHFVAAFIPVLLHKNYPAIFQKNENPSILFEIAQSPFVSIFYNGHLPVLIFFVLSGYVLALPYFIDDFESLRRRVWGRYLRLNLPIVASLILSFIVYKTGFYYNVKAADISGSSPWLDRFFPLDISLINLFEYISYKSIIFGDGSLNPPLWTLKIEFIGSIYLLTFYLCNPGEGIRVFIATILMSLLLYTYYKSDSIYYIAIFIGALLNQTKVSRKLGRTLFFSGFYFGAFQFESSFYEFLPDVKIYDIEIFEKKTFYNTIAAIFITASIISGFGQNLLESKPVQFLGRISFPLYLLHMIVLGSVTCIFYLALPQTKVTLVACFASYISINILASYLFERFIDKPSIYIANRFSYFMTKEAR